MRYLWYICSKDGPLLHCEDSISNYPAIYQKLEISTRGHEYEKGYWIKNVVLPSLGDNFMVNNNVDAKSDIPSLESTYYVYVWKAWCKSRQFCFKFWPLTLNDLDLDQIWPHRIEPLKGNSKVSLHTLTKFCEIGPPRTWERNKCNLWAPTTLTFAETNP
jgi:hypothetical protein